MSLAMLPVGETGVIIDFRGKEGIKRHLQNLGLIIGEEIKVVCDNSSGLILLVKGARVALNKGIASLIMVKENRNEA